MAETLHRMYPQYNIAGNLMRYIRDNWEARDDDTEAISNDACAKLFKAFDPDESGEMNFFELFKLFEFLKIPLRLLCSQGATQDGKVTPDEFGPMLRAIDSENKSLNIAVHRRFGARRDERDLVPFGLARGLECQLH